MSLQIAQKSLSTLSTIVSNQALTPLARGGLNSRTIAYIQSGNSNIPTRNISFTGFAAIGWIGIGGVLTKEGWGDKKANRNPNWKLLTLAATTTGVGIKLAYIDKDTHEGKMRCLGPGMIILIPDEVIESGKKAASVFVDKALS